MTEPYLYPLDSKRAPRNPNVERLGGFSANSDPIPLTGWVHGKKASDLEERVYRGAKISGLTDQEINFQVPFQTMLPFTQELDFVFRPSFIQPTEVDGPMGHTNSAQQGVDDYREALLNPEFMKIGWLPLERIKWFEIPTQDKASYRMRLLLR